jgi:glycosyltransferase involved in cell wall biosynthesis
MRPICDLGMGGIMALHALASADLSLRHDNPDIESLKVALVHDWLVEFGGAEQVLGSLLEIWPQAPVYTLIFDPQGQCAELLAGRQVIPSFLQHIPGAVHRHRWLLPLMPLAIEQFDLSNYDLVFSSSYAVAKGVLTHPRQLHICYIHTPMRYAWEMQSEYLKSAGLERGLRAAMARLVLHYLRQWDVSSASRVDVFLANSQHTAARVRKTYRRTARVIYPPVDTNALQPGAARSEFYLTVSRLVPYKKIDLLVEAFRGLPDRKLVVIGDGPELSRLKKMAGANITFLGYQPFNVVRDYLQRARAFLFVAQDDFGLAPLEAQACGTPVIAYKAGGALETVQEGHTGLFFLEQSAESLCAAVRAFEAWQNPYDSVELYNHAQAFNKARFQAEIKDFVQRRWKYHTVHWPD